MRRVVIWGGRSDDIQLGSRADRQRQAVLRLQHTLNAIGKVYADAFAEMATALRELDRQLAGAFRTLPANLRALDRALTPRSKRR